MLMVLDRSELTVRLVDGVVQVYHGESLLQRAATNLLEMLVVYGNPLVESSVWRALAQAGVPAVILASRGMQTTALLAEGLATQLPARRLQYACAESDVLAVQLARWVLVRKVLSYQLPFLVLEPHLDSVLAGRFRETQQQQLGKLHQAQSVDVFLGLEGIMSREWFQLLAAVLPEQWKFIGRNRQPPRDPLNALLSLGYTLALADIRQMVIAEGFDPAFGFLHQPYPAREALALDVLEIFRSGVDLFALNLLAELTPESFYYRESEGCRLSKAARPLFYREWAIYRDNWPRPLAGNRGGQLETAPLQEQVRGQLRLLRQVLEEVKDAG